MNLLRRLNSQENSLFIKETPSLIECLLEKGTVAREVAKINQKIAARRQPTQEHLQSATKYSDASHKTEATEGVSGSRKAPAIIDVAAPIEQQGMVATKVREMNGVSGAKHRPTPEGNTGNQEKVNPLRRDASDDVLVRQPHIGAKKGKEPETRSTGQKIAAGVMVGAAVLAGFTILAGGPQATKMGVMAFIQHGKGVAASTRAQGQSLVSWAWRLIPGNPRRNI